MKRRWLKKQENQNNRITALNLYYQFRLSLHETSSAYIQNENWITRRLRRLLLKILDYTRTIYNKLAHSRLDPQASCLMLMKISCDVISCFDILHTTYLVILTSRSFRMHAKAQCSLKPDEMRLWSEVRQIFWFHGQRKRNWGKPRKSQRHRRNEVPNLPQGSPESEWSLGRIKPLPIHGERQVTSLLPNSQGQPQVRVDAGMRSCLSITQAAPVDAPGSGKTWSWWTTFSWCKC